MIKANELQKWADDLKPVLFDINVSLNNIFLLKHEKSTNFRINYNEVYLSLFYQQHFILIIQLTKIFSTKNKTHKRNINKLFNKFQNEPLDEEIKSMLQLNKCNSNNGFKSKKDILKAIHEFKIDLKSNSENIKSIINLRDKVFAHTDPLITEEQMNIDQLTTLVNLGNKIYNTLFGKILVGENFNKQITHRYDLRNIIDLYNELDSRTGRGN
jgi:hypothetical protein